MKYEIVAQNEAHVTGVLSGWDRLVFRGCLTSLAYLEAMSYFLRRMGIMLKDYAEWALEMSEAMKQACLTEAERQGRPVMYLRSSEIRKDELSRQILRSHPVAEGLICLFTCLEPCMTYRVRGNRQTQRLELRREQSKCLHVYKYWIDSQFGFMGARLQTWLPCSIQVYVNGREWLARRMDRRGMGYQREGNCFPQIDDFAAAQKMMNQMQRTPWIRSLDRLRERLCPGYAKRLEGDCYWTAFQTEWATDISFDSAASLQAIYNPLVRGAITALGCEDILRFMNKRRSFQGEIESDLRQRVEGVRIKHRLGGNSVKAYDKAGSVLRIETTINNPDLFRVFRAAQGAPEGEKEWRPLRKSVVDMSRRAEVSQQVNDRYADALASLDTTTPLGELIAPICRPLRRQGVRCRALQPWSDDDRRLIEAAARGEFVTDGFTNGDIASHLYPRKNADKSERARIASRVCYRLRLLRQHGLIRKVKNQRRYHVTPKGRRIFSVVLASQHATLQQLNALAA
jgi:hypothetical protein